MKTGSGICSLRAASARGCRAAANFFGFETTRSMPGHLIAVGTLWLTGCASTPLPPEAMEVSTVAVSSKSVEIHQPRLIMKEGELRLEAYAMRQWKAETTADTHVDIVFFNAAGSEIAVETTNFHPRSLPRTMRLPGPHAYLLMPIQIPDGARALEVRAHDAPHETPPAKPSRISMQN